MRIRPVLLRLMALGLGVAIALLLGELFLRLAHPWIGRHSDTMFTVIQYDPELGWRMPRGVEARVDFVDREGLTVTSNRWGFWARSWNPEKTPGRCRVVCLGDSFTWGMGVEQAERFTDQLERLDSHLEVLNLGMPGFGVDQALLTWRAVARELQPDAVVLTVFQNDLGDNHFDFRYGRAKPYFLLRESGQLELMNVPVRDLDFWDSGIMHQVAPPYRKLYPVSTLRRNRLVHWVGKNSDLARLTYTLWRNHALRWRASSGETAKASSTVLDSLGQSQIRLLQALVAQLGIEVNQAGAHLLVALAGDRNPQIRALEDGLTNAGIAKLDVTTEKLSGHLGTQPVYYRYNQHWTAHAHEAVAALLQPHLRAACGEAPVNP